MNTIKSSLLGTAIAIFLLIGLHSCHKISPCLHGNGEAVIEERMPGEFSRLEVNGAYELHVFPSDEHYLTVDAESNLIDFVRTRSNGTTLVVETQSHHCLNPSMPVIINVYTPYVDAFTMNGSGTMTAYGLFADEIYATLNGSGFIDLDIDTRYFQANIAGSGDIEVTGVSALTDLRISGSGNIYAFGLAQSRCEASISGSGKMYLHVNRKLRADISGSGTIFYRGNPDIDYAITGTGKLIKQ